MSPGQHSEPRASAELKPSSGDPMTVCVLFKAHAAPDEELALILARELRVRGYTVLLDKRQTTGLTWVKNLEAQIRQSDLVVPLLSEKSVQSECSHAKSRWQIRPRRNRAAAALNAGPSPL